MLSARTASILDSSTAGAFSSAMVELIVTLSGLLMSATLKNIGLVTLIAAGSVLPAMVATQPPAPLVYAAVAGVIGSLAAGLVPALVGGAIIASGGRLKTAIIATLLVSAFFSFTLLYPYLRG